MPLSKERAVELWEQDLTVYLLYEDNTEAMAFDRADIDNHNGLFGIEKADWTALQELEEIKGDGKLSPDMREQLFLEKGKDAYAIYQLKDGAELRDYRFEGMDWIKSKELSVERENYNLVYTDTFTKFAGTRDRLEELWDRFNNDHPADFTGHSLSVSDIVAIKKSNVVSYHYCDSFDFVELPNFMQEQKQESLTYYVAECMEFTTLGEYHENLTLAEAVKLYNDIPAERMNGIKGIGFALNDGSIYDGGFSILNGNTIDADTINDIAHFKNSPLVQDAVRAVIQAFPKAELIDRQENYLKTAELSTEQNYNQIDGIINNEPTVAELEHDAKNGKPISLMDLLDATRKEEKQSVMKQLKTKPPQNSKKEKTAPSKGAEMER